MEKNKWGCILSFRIGVSRGEDEKRGGIFFVIFIDWWKVTKKVAMRRMGCMKDD